MVKNFEADFLSRRANTQNVGFETLYGGQLTLSTQLIKPNYPVVFPTDTVPRFL